MKKYIILFLCICLGPLFLTSCLEKYLDKAPESGLNENLVFSKYANTKSYFDNVYGTVWNAAPLKIDWSGNMCMDGITDWADMGRIIYTGYYKLGPLGDIMQEDFGKNILDPFPKNIRICNMLLQNIGRLTDGKQEDIDDLIGQAHFIRAFCHFELFRYWGGWPYITKPLGNADSWDIPRLSKHETMVRVAADMDTAYTYFEKAGKIRRDPLPGQAGNLNAPDQNRPSGVTAKAYKSRALLYTASPLNNELGVKDWEEAAKASWEAIQKAEQNGYSLQTVVDYTKNYWGTTYTNEQLWANYYGTSKYSDTYPNKMLLNAVFGNSASSFAGIDPTQGAVDCFETRWGDPLNTQAQRDAATALGHYNEQNPFVDRDPRLAIDIIYNTAPIPGYTTAKIYFDASSGTSVGSELIPNTGYAGITRTGYYQRKLWGGQSVKNNVSVQYTYLMIRLGELYLNYAEAANEAYGPNTAAPGATMSAVDAINKIRNGTGRWTTAQMAPVQDQFKTNTDALRPRIRNERKVELCFEGHYYFDIRRWMEAPVTMGSPMMGNIAEKVTTSPTYPTGYKYTRTTLSPERQCRWIDAMYYLPFRQVDYFKMKNFDLGQVW